MKVRTHTASDGHIEITVFPTEDIDAINKASERCNPGYPYKLHEHTDLPDFYKSDKWREVNGTIKVDETIETPSEKNGKIKNNVKTKLTLLGFTKEEIEMLIR